MQNAASARLREYQRELTVGYECLRRGDRIGYSTGLYRADRVVDQARLELSRRELLLFERAASRSVDVLRKCLLLGLSNLEKRLAEYRLVETMSLLLAAHGAERRRELAEENRWLLAA